MTPVGRPEVGTPINVRLGNDLLARVDQYAQAQGFSRAEAIRDLVQSGLRKRRYRQPDVKETRERHH